MLLIYQKQVNSAIATKGKYRNSNRANFRIERKIQKYDKIRDVPLYK